MTDPRFERFNAIALALRASGLSIIDAWHCAALLENAEHPRGPERHLWAMGRATR